MCCDCRVCALVWCVCCVRAMVCCDCCVHVLVWCACRVRALVCCAVWFACCFKTVSCPVCMCVRVSDLFCVVVVGYGC